MYLRDVIGYEGVIVAFAGIVVLRAGKSTVHRTDELECRPAITTLRLR